MLSELFDDMDTHLQGLFLSLLLFGERDDLDKLLSFLPNDERLLLKQRTGLALRLGRAEKLNLFVRQLQKMMRYDAQSRLLAIDPSWIEDKLRNEYQSMRDFLIAALPDAVARSLRGEVPKKAENRDDELARYLCETFEASFAPMPFRELYQHFDVRHLILLSKKEWEKVLPALGRTVEAEENNDQLKSAGLRAIARALHLRDLELILQIAQRMDISDGRFLIDAFRKMKEDQVELPEQSQDLIRELLMTIIRLSKEQLIDDRFATCTVAF